MKKLVGCALMGLALFTGGCAVSPATDQSIEQPTPAEGAALSSPRGPVTIPSQCLSKGLWNVVCHGYQIPVPDNQRVALQREWLSQRPDFFASASRRGERYLYFIVKEAEKRQMPLEFALLPIVESAFNPFARSVSNAVGPWQFMAATAGDFDLQQNWWYDGRRDIVRSTRAALDYLQQLAQRFNGNWVLALAAYNAGGGTVSRAQRANKAKGEPVDFWHLNLPRETTEYVPRLLAVAQIVSDPQRYGITLQPVANQPYFHIVDLNSQIDLAKAATLAGISEQEMSMLNPGYSRWATPPGGPYQLLLPVGKVAHFRQRLAAIPADQRVRPQRYTIRRGDSLIAIARRYHTSVASLRRANDLRGSRIVAGRTLIVPTTRGSGEQVATTQTATSSPRQPVDYRVNRGDTLWSIAQRHQVSVNALAKWNDMTPSDPLQVGQTLAIRAGADRDAESTRKVHYSVRRGDSLYAIADRFDLSVNQIRDWNQTVASNRYLRPGDRLTLYVGSGSAL